MVGDTSREDFHASASEKDALRIGAGEPSVPKRAARPDPAAAAAPPCPVRIGHPPQHLHITDTCPSPSPLQARVRSPAAGPPPPSPARSTLLGGLGAFLREAQRCFTWEESSATSERRLAGRKARTVRLLSIRSRDQRVLRTVRLLVLGHVISTPLF